MTLTATYNQNFIIFFMFIIIHYFVQMLGLEPKLPESKSDVLTNWTTSVFIYFWRPSHSTKLWHPSSFVSLSYPIFQIHQLIPKKQFSVFLKLHILYYIKYKFVFLRLLKDQLILNNLFPNIH